MISLKEDLINVTSWEEAFTNNRSLMSNEENAWVKWFLERTINNPENSNAAYGVSDLLRELVIRFRMYPKPVDSLKLRTAIEELEEDYNDYRSNLFNPRIRLALMEGEDERYIDTLGVSLLPYLPSSLIASWDGFINALWREPAVILTILRNRFKEEEDILCFDFIKKTVTGSSLRSYNSHGMELGLLFSEDKRKDFRERFSIICSIIEAASDQWDEEEGESGYPSSRRVMFTKLYTNMVEEIRIKDDLHNVPDSWIKEIYSV